MQIDVIALAGRHPSAPATAPPAVAGLNLQVSTGEQLAIIGPSGAGKTTLLHLLACALKPTAGSLRLDGQDPWALKRSALQKLRGCLFLAPQVPPLPPRQRVVTSVLAGRLPHQSLWASVRSLLYPTDLARAERALAGFGLADKLFDRVDRLSGGERQRVGLARALVALAGPTRLLLVDEPLSALDPSRSETALQALTEAARDQGATLIATLHHVDMALAQFPRIVGLRQGAVVFDLPAAQVTPAVLHDLYAQHLHELLGPAIPADTAVAAPPAPVALVCR